MLNCQALSHLGIWRAPPCHHGESNQLLLVRPGLLVRVVVDVHHHWHLLLSLGQVPPHLEQDFGVHELKDVHDAHIDIRRHIVPMAQEKHLLVVHTLVP